MAFEDKQEVKQTQKDFVAPSSCSKCNRQATVALATCVNTGTGAIKTGAASEFCGRDNHNNPDWVLQDWWQLTQYQAYCPDCYAGLSQPGQRKYTDDQVRVAWKWFIGEMAHRAEGDALGTAFKRVVLNDRQRDAAIEIVNYEAHRTNQPDSIPDEYKLQEVWG